MGTAGFLIAGRAEMTDSLFKWNVGDAVEWDANIARKGITIRVTMTGTVKTARGDGWYVVRVETPEDHAGRLMTSTATDLRSRTTK